MNSVSPMNFFRTTDTTDMFGHQMGSDKVCEGCFFKTGFHIVVSVVSVVPVVRKKIIGQI